MNLETLLSEQGSNPLTDKVNGVTLRALINSNFKRLGLEPINATTPSESILETIYGIEDQTVKDILLNKQVAEVKGNQNFKRFLSFTAIIATIVAFAFFTWVVKGDTPLTAEEVDLIKSISHGVLDVVGELVKKPDA